MYLKKTVIYHNCSGQAIRIMEMKLMFGVWPNEKDPIILRAFLQSFEIRIQNTKRMWQMNHIYNNWIEKCTKYNKNW